MVGRCGLIDLGLGCNVATVPPLRDPAHKKKVRRKKPGRSGRDDKKGTAHVCGNAFE